MAEYSVKALNKISTDTIVQQSNVIEQGANGLKLGSKGYAVFLYTYDKVKKFLQTNTLKIYYNILSSSAIDKYKTICKIKLTIQYYDETKDENGETIGLVEGTTSTYTVYPVYSNQANGYIGDSIVAIRNQPIKRLKLEIYNNTANQIDIRNVQLYPENTVKRAIEDMGVTITLENVERYDDGMTCNFTGGGRLDLWFIGEQEDNPRAIDVNHTRLVTIVDIPGKKPI